MIGKTVSHYKILEKLGEGGMGVVYKAEDSKLKRTVALKFLPPDLTRDADAKKRFIHEAQAASTLDHSNICTIYEVEETDDGQTFIAMAFYEGETLRDRIKQSPLKIEEAMDIAVQIADGLKEAHEKNIVHRDVKAANVMITTKGQAKVLDFGLARLTGQTKLTKTGTTLGTAAYMSPEQTRGDQVDHRSDIWSLGVILYEMLTGHLPFKGEYEQAIVYSIVNDDVEPITGLRTGIPMALERIVNKTLEKNPDERYQHVDELIVDLKRALKESDGTTSERDDSGKKVNRSSRAIWALTITCFVVIIAIVGYFLIRGRQRNIAYAMERISESREQNSVAVMYFENNTGDTNLDHWRKAITDLLITDLAQSRYVRVLSGDRLYQILTRLRQVEAKTYSSNVLRQVGDRGNIKYVILGKYARSGDLFRLDVTLQDALTGEVISGLRVEDQGEESMFAMVDDLTKKIKQNFNLSQDELGNDIDDSIGKITTNSPEAYRYYIEGRNHHDLRNYQKTIASMEKAVAVDPEFAMAYRAMAVAHFNLRYHALGRTHLQKAMALSDRVSEGERYRIMGDYYRQSEEYFEEAIEAYKRALVLYPDDHIANHNLALLYNVMGQQDDAIAHYEILRNNKTYGFITYENLAYIYFSKGMYDRARDVLQGYIKTFADHDGAHNSLALSHLFQEKFDLALEEVDKALFLAPARFENYILKGDITLCSKNWMDADEYYQKAVEMKNPIASAMGLWGMGSWYLLQGQFEKAEIQLREAVGRVDGLNAPYIESICRLILSMMQYHLGKYEAAQNELNLALKGFTDVENKNFQRTTMYAQGWIFLALNSWDEAQKKAQDIKTSTEGGYNERHSRYYYLLMGMIESKRGHFSRAIGHLNKAVSLLHHESSTRFNYASFYKALAVAYEGSGDGGKAQEAYEKILTMTGGRISSGNIYAQSFYQLGKIYQEKGWNGKAIEHYSQFIEYWKDCDPEFKYLVEDAREQVSILEK